MVALIGALVPLMVALISTLRWPTLRRRIRDHTTLAKELPAELAEPLCTLLAEEVAQMIARDRGLLDRRTRALRYSWRVSVTAWVAIVLWGAFTAVAYLLYLRPVVAEVVLYVLAAIAVLGTVTAVLARRRLSP